MAEKMLMANTPEVRAALNAKSKDELHALFVRWEASGHFGDSVETFLRWFSENPGFEGRVCLDLNLKTESEKALDIALWSAEAAKVAAIQAAKSHRIAIWAMIWAAVSAIASVVSATESKF